MYHSKPWILLVFCWLLAGPPIPAAEEPGTGLSGGDPRVLPATGPHRLAIIIDDMGHARNSRLDERLMALPVEIAFSIIPRTPGCASLVEHCRREDREYLAHLPWQPMNRELPREATLMAVNSSRSILYSLLLEAVECLPGMIAANNHQGSLASLDERFLERFAGIYAGLELPFIDSRTVGGSKVKTALGRHGIPVLENNLFLDHEDDPRRIRARLRDLLRLAAGRPTTIAIAHPRLNTLDALEEFLERLPDWIELVPPSEFMPRRKGMNDALAEIAQGIRRGSAGEPAESGEPRREGADSLP